MSLVTSHLKKAILLGNKYLCHAQIYAKYETWLIYGKYL